MCMTRNKPVKMLKCKYHIILKNNIFLNLFIYNK